MGQSPMLLYKILLIGADGPNTKDFYNQWAFGPYWLTIIGPSAPKLLESRGKAP